MPLAAEPAVKAWVGAPRFVELSAQAPRSGARVRPWPLFSWRKPQMLPKSLLLGQPASIDENFSFSIRSSTSVLSFFGWRSHPVQTGFWRAFGSTTLEKEECSAASADR